MQHPSLHLFMSLGAKKQKTPVELDDDGRSTSRGVVTEIISEGVIEGILGGRKGIYLDRTPLRNEDNSNNFQGVRFVHRRGTATQRIPETYGDEIAAETGVNVEVTKAVGTVTRTIINPELDKIRIRIGVQLIKYEEDGDVRGNSVTFKIFTKEGTDAYVERAERTINAKFSSLTEFEYEYRVSNLGGTRDTFAIRLQRITDDTDSQRDVIKLQWQSYTEITTNKLNYPHSALIMMQFPAEYFQSIPARAYKIGGIRVQIPSNASLDADGSVNFGGTWDGTFYTPGRACSDPVWQLYDLLTNKRYGLGRYIREDQIDKYSFYECSVYNNGIVPDGFGGTERRFTCKTQLQSAEGAWDVINAFCSSFHAKPYWSDGKLRLWQDRPRPVVWQFTQADVENGDFTYSSTAIRTRFTQALITWNDPNDFFGRAIEPIDDAEGIEQYGIRETEAVAFGCTSRGQARRHGLWLLKSSLLETETVAFKARSYAGFVRPGEIIQIANATRAGIRYGGLIKNATPSAVELDNLVFLYGTGTYTLTVMMPDGTLESRAVINGAGNHSILTVSQPFSEAPLREANWVVSSTTSAVPQLYTVLSVTLSEDPTLIEIQALQHVPGKYDLIENDIPIVELPTRSSISAVIPAPTAVRAEYILVTNTLTTTVTLVASWTPPLVNGILDPSVVGFYVEWSPDGIVWEDTRIVKIGVAETRFEGLRLNNTYYVRVASIGADNNTSGWTASVFVSTVPSVTASIDFSLANAVGFQ